ncbi:MAG: AP2/ERF family transcription factor, partial [Gemmataceae bacterium]
QKRSFLVHDRDTFKELADLEASTLSAPKGLHDDRAIAFGLCVAAVANPPRTPALYVVGGEPDAKTSETEGVRWVPAWETWVAEAPDPDDPGGPRKHLGEYDTEAEAAEAVRQFRQKIPGTQ